MRLRRECFDLNKLKRSLISQLLCGLLPIAIETGRYYNISRNERVCQLCGNDVDCEFHFLFNCTSTHDKHMQECHKVPELLQYSNETDKLKFLLTKPYILGNYINSLWQERNAILSNKMNIVCDNSLLRVGATIV